MIPGALEEASERDVPAVRDRAPRGGGHGAVEDQAGAGAEVVLPSVKRGGLYRHLVYCGSDQEWL